MSVKYQINLRNLPENRSLMQPGCVYAIVHSDNLPVTELIRKTLTEAATDGQAVWITHDDPKKLLLEWHPASDIDALLDSGRLRLCRLNPLRVDKPYSVLLEDLNLLGVGRTALVVIDDAKAFYGPESDSHDPFLLHQCRQQIERSERRLLLLFPHRPGETDPTRDLLRNANQLAGLARIWQADGHAYWQTLHWLGSHGIEGSETWSLQRDESGFSLERRSIEQPGQGPTFDEQEVFITRACLAGQELSPPDWHVKEDLPSLIEAVQGVRSATLIVPFDRDTEPEMLARTLFDLRQNLGSGVRIIVREVNMHVRHAWQRQLLHAGADFIAPAETGMAFLESLTDTLRQYVRIRSNDPLLSKDIVSNRPPGFLPPAEFVRSVRDTLQKSRRVFIRNALIRLRPANNQPLGNLISQFASRRAGDLCTDDGKDLYVFLFACRENDIDKALNQIFLSIPSELFESEIRFLTEEDIDRQLDDLAGAVPAAPMNVFPDSMAATSPLQLHKPLAAVRRSLPLRRVPSGDPT